MFNFIQLETVDLNLVFIFSYIILIIIKPSAARIKVFAAVLICIAISYSPLYELMNNTQYYAFMCLVYVITYRKITSKKVSATCCIMSIFEFLMLTDRYINAGVETWLYIHFEEITVIIHSLIISSFFEWNFERWRGFLGYIANSVRRILCFVRNASCLCYYYCIDEEKVREIER